MPRKLTTTRRVLPRLRRGDDLLRWAEMLVSRLEAEAGGGTPGPAGAGVGTAVTAHGADPTGVADSAPGFNAAVAAVQAAGGGTVAIPPGIYKLNAPVVLDAAGQTFDSVGRVNLIGAGSSVVRLDYGGPAGSSAITVKGPVWAAGVASYSRQTISGFRLKGWDPRPEAEGGQGHVGLDLYQGIQLRVLDVQVDGFTFGVYGTDLVGVGFYDCYIRFNNFGMRLVPGPQAIGLDIGSPVNELLFSNCHFTNNRQWAIHADRSANLVFTGGSFEYTGLPGSWTSDVNRFNLRITNAGHNGSFGLALYGVHFESSAGQADIWIEHDDYPCSYVVNGCDFLQNGASNFIDHSILFETTGTTAAHLSVIGCGFRGVNGYVPSTSRRVVHLGSIAGSLHRVTLLGNVYGDAAEVPVGGFGLGDLRCEADGGGLVARSPNGAVTKRIGIDNSGAVVVSDP